MAYVGLGNRAWAGPGSERSGPGGAFGREVPPPQCRTGEFPTGGGMEGVRSGQSLFLSYVAQVITWERRPTKWRWIT